MSDIAPEALNDYLPVLLLAGFAVSFAALNIIASALLGKKAGTNPDKDSAFECGMLPLQSSRRRFSVKFYVVAMLFILFDIEVVFLYPWAVKFRDLGWVGFVEMLVFLTVLTVGWWYVVRKGALDWAPRRSAADQRAMYARADQAAAAARAAQAGVPSGKGAAA
ncbi:MAG: NADH-quinone oxidoreductase subunit A [Planctomycetota bacterium]